MSCVTTCHVSRVTCHVSGVTCHMYFLFFFFFGQSGEAYRWRVCYQRGLPRLVLDASVISCNAKLQQSVSRKTFSINCWYWPLTETADSWQLYNGKPTLDNGKLILDNGKPTLDNGKLILDNGKPLLDNGKLILDNGKLIYENGKFILNTDDRQWKMENRQWAMENRQRTMENQDWSMKNWY